MLTKINIKYTTIPTNTNHLLRHFQRLIVWLNKNKLSNKSKPWTHQLPHTPQLTMLLRGRRLTHETPPWFHCAPHTTWLSRRRCQSRLILLQTITRCLHRCLQRLGCLWSIDGGRRWRWQTKATAECQGFRVRERSNDRASETVWGREREGA